MHIAKVVETGKGAQDKVLAGVEFLSDAVARTLGPFGSNALLEKGLRVTNDGVTIASQLQLEDEIQDLALRKAREAGVRANDKAGDGSTTTILLTHKIFKRVLKESGTGGFAKKRPTVEVLRQVEREKDEVIAKLKDMATPVETVEQLVHSATVSVEDPALGKLIGTAQFDLGPDGFLTAEEVNDRETSVERVIGIRIDNGLGMTQAINNQEKQSLEIADTPVIMTTHVIETLVPFKQIGEALAKRGIRRLAIIARGFSTNAIQEAQLNGQQGFNIFPINAPYTDQREVMKDLEAILGGRFVDFEDGAIDSIQISDLGHCRFITARRYDAVFSGMDTEAIRARVAKRIDTLKETLKGSPSDFEKKTLAARIAQLKDGFGVVKVGALSETDRKRVFDKVEDAVNATRAAYQEGTVKGAGLAFKEIADTLPDSYLLKEPLGAIHEQIMANAPTDFVVEDWVRDPLKVLRIALEQACSVASDLATVEIAVHAKREKPKEDD